MYIDSFIVIQNLKNSVNMRFFSLFCDIMNAWKIIPCAHLAERTAESCAAIWERNIPWKASAGRYWHRAILKGHTGRSHSGADFTVI